MEKIEKEVFSFLFSHEGPIFDVRSPCEFQHGSIPGSVSLPLFSDEERHHVGCCYKEKGKEAAIQLGLSYVGPQMARFAETLKQHKNLRLLCFRGGMRSSSMSWLAQLFGCHVVRLAKGYKSYRRWVLSSLNESITPIVLSGPTGSGKTELLQLLFQHSHPILDLEALANHRGSVFGGFQGSPQPTQEQFENRLAHTLYPLLQSPYLFAEAESRTIGRLVVPLKIYEAIHSAPLLILNCPLEERVTRIVREYGSKPTEELTLSIEKISKRLGGVLCKETISLVKEGHIEEAAKRLLSYYDTTYAHCLEKHTGPRLVVDRAELVTAIQERQIEPFLQKKGFCLPTRESISIDKSARSF